MASYYSGTRKYLVFFSIFFYLLIITSSLEFSSPSPSPSPSYSPTSTPSHSESPSPSTISSSFGFSPLNSPYSSPSNSPSPSPSESPSPTSSPIDMDPENYYRTHPDKLFFDFKLRYGKNYKTKEEEDYRFSLFKSNLELAMRHNDVDPHAAHGITRFSDLTQEEFLNTFLGGQEKYIHDHRPLPDHDMASILPTSDFPELYNWRHQHDDGAPITIATNNLVVAVSSDEDQIKSNLLKYGPLAIGFDATFMQTFAGGTSCPTTCSNQVNHGALLIGYDTFSSYTEGDEPDIPYWTITNSPYPPGPEDYDEGYYTLCRGQNVCGVESMVSTIPAALSNTIRPVLG